MQLRNRRRPPILWHRWCRSGVAPKDAPFRCLPSPRTAIAPPLPCHRLRSPPFSATMLSSAARRAMRFSSSPSSLLGASGGRGLLGRRLASTDCLAELGLSTTAPNAGVYFGEWKMSTGAVKRQVNPSTGEVFCEVQCGAREDYDEAVERMTAAKSRWANTPAPVRGEVVRRIGEALRAKQSALGELVSMEMGKIRAEGVGEVQEAIDICDLAVGLSRALNGSIIPSERADHMMLERYNPLSGHVGIITAFNFPVAVYFWNLALSLVCGNTNIWKPAGSVSAVGVACTKIISEVFDDMGYDGAIASMVCGAGPDVGDPMIHDERMDLISFTGSTQVGQRVSEVVSKRFGRRILELGGNNATVVDKSADLEMCLRASLFGAVGTAGQRCTSLRRLLIHEDVYDDFVTRLVNAYRNVQIGGALEEGTLCGPVHNQGAIEEYELTINQAKEAGHNILIGGNVLTNRPGYFVEPTIIEVEDKDAYLLTQERFVPILYVVKIRDVDEGIALNNSVTQGLSSSLFTKDTEQIFKWLGPEGSDCGIVNVNIGTSGAEIGGPFGSNKEGEGRESGGTSWKQYCRLSTCTINHGSELPLAQGINFG